MLGDVLEEQDAAVDLRAGSGVPTRCATIARLPPHSVPSRCRRRGRRARIRPRTRVAAEQPQAMVERERRRRRGAEIVRGHRPGERRHPGVRERGQLERREVASGRSSACRSRASAAIVEAVEEARPAVAAAHRDRDVDVVASSAMRAIAARRSSSVAGEALPARSRASDRRRRDGRAAASRADGARRRPRARSRSRPARRGRSRRSRHRAQRRARRNRTAARRIRRRARRAVTRRVVIEPRLGEEVDHRAARRRSSGSRAPNTTRAIRACRIAPAHIAHGSIVT